MITAAQALPADPFELARNGDAAAFAEIVRRHESMVFSLAVHVLGSRAAAEDLAQEVFLELYRHLPRLESAEHVVWWLRRVTCHRCIDELRRPKHRLERQMDAVPDRGVSPPARELFLEDRLHLLVERLPPVARIVITLRYQEELEPSAIAKTLGMPVNTVKSHIRRSLAVLRASLLEERGP